MTLPQLARLYGVDIAPGTNALNPWEAWSDATPESPGRWRAAMLRLAVGLRDGFGANGMHCGVPGIPCAADVFHLAADAWNDTPIVTGGVYALPGVSYPDPARTDSVAHAAPLPCVASLYRLPAELRRNGDGGYPVEGLPAWVVMRGGVKPLNARADPPPWEQQDIVCATAWGSLDTSTWGAMMPSGGPPDWTDYLPLGAAVLADGRGGFTQRVLRTSADVRALVQMLGLPVPGDAGWTTPHVAAYTPPTRAVWWELA